MNCQRSESSFARYAGALLAISAIYYILSASYYLYFHPLAKFPGPFLAKFSAWLSYYHTLKGDRHIWIWQCHQIYGSAFRYRHDGVLFNTPAAHRAIYETKSNVQKGKFYEVWPIAAGASNTWNSIDKAKHARKRRILNAAFSDKALKSAEPFIIHDADRWCELLIEGSGKEWSEARNMGDWSDYLVMDILGELCYGRSFNLKEPGNNEFRAIPQLMNQYMGFLNRLANAPFRGAWVWLKPRGLDKLFQRMGPESIRSWTSFVDSCLEQRINEHTEIQENYLTTKKGRDDMFHHILQAKDPETGQPGYSRAELHNESEQLVIAGSDTTATVFAAMFFYLTRYPIVYAKLTAEIRTAFTDVGQIRDGVPLNSCRYLRAFIDETMRMNPPVGVEPVREAMAGGTIVEGHHLTQGICLGVSIYALHHNQDIFPDAPTFKPERWIPDEVAGTTAESVLLSRSAFVPFSTGPRGCPGKNLAYMEMSIVMAKILFLADVRSVEGNDLGAGRPEMIWGRRNKMQYQAKDAFVSAKDGPMVQFKARMM